MKRSNLPSTNPATNPSRYTDEVFRHISIKKDLSYSPDTKISAHQFDWYEPQDDSAALRPLIIWMHGGGFKFGSKHLNSIRLWSKFFAHRGYVCAAINYRLGRKDLSFHFDHIIRDCYEAVRDCRLAIAYFKSQASQLRIDRHRIILAGNSAGGILALQTTYASDSEMLKLLGRPDFETASHSIDPGDVAAVLNFWGGIFQTDWLRNARVPIFSVHGRLDNIVPYDYKGFPLYGSAAIHRTADSLGIPNRLLTYDKYRHELQRGFNPLFQARATKKRWREAAQCAADFLCRELFDDKHGEDDNDAEDDKRNEDGNRNDQAT